MAGRPDDVKPRSRRRSMDEPPSMSQLLDVARSFTHLYRERKRELKEIIEHFQKIAKETGDAEHPAKTAARQAGASAAAGGVGVGAGLLFAPLLFAPFTGGLSLTAAVAAAAFTAVAGAGVVAGVNISEALVFREKGKQIQEHGDAFLSRIQPLLDQLREFKHLYKRLIEINPTLAAATHQAETTLSGKEELSSLLQRVSRQTDTINLDIVAVFKKSLSDFKDLIVILFSVTGPPDIGSRLLASFKQVIELSERLMRELEVTSNTLGKCLDSSKS